MPSTQRLSPQLSRRGFLAATGGLGAALALAACSSSGGNSSGGGLSGTSTALLPSTAPVGWSTVIAQANAKLKKDLGFTLDAQFTAWTNYGQQALLKFTAGAHFDTALEALWLNMSQLVQSQSLVDLSGEIGKYPNLKAQLSPQLIAANTWSGGKLWGIPQVNSAGRIQHFTIRQDLAEKYGFSDIQDYDTLERYFYAVKQKAGITPFAASSNSTFLYVVPGPVGLFNAQSWSDPLTSAHQFTGSNLYFLFDRNAATTGSANPKPFWEDAGCLDAFNRIRTYNQDGIIDANAISTDQATAQSRWNAGGYGSIWAMSDGTSSNGLPTLQKTVKSAQLANVMPLPAGAKPLQTFQADNLVVVNANGGDLDRTMHLQDWLSVQENHDLLEYGIQGTDWEPATGNKYKILSQYAFPGFGLLWRSKLERRSLYMTASEEKIFDWAQDYGNFTLDPFATFIPDITPVKQEIAQMTNVMTQYANPLYYGVTDVTSQLSKLKAAADSAGLAKLQAEMAKQADAHLKAQKS